MLVICIIHRQQNTDNTDIAHAHKCYAIYCFKLKIINIKTKNESMTAIRMLRVAFLVTPFEKVRVKIYVTDDFSVGHFYNF